MKARRKIIVYTATSPDGYIARPNGDVEWLNRRLRTVDYGMRPFYPTIDTILRGRKPKVPFGKLRAASLPSPTSSL